MQTAMTEKIFPLSFVVQRACFYAATGRLTGRRKQEVQPLDHKVVVVETAGGNHVEGASLVEDPFYWKHWLVVPVRSPRVVAMEQRSGAPHLGGFEKIELASIGALRPGKLMVRARLALRVKFPR
jgi:hypothetical protein